MLNPKRADREYPPTPYPGDVEKTREYRDGWDAGWDFAVRRGIAQAADFYPPASPERPYGFGARQGVLARNEWLKRRKKAIRNEMQPRPPTRPRREPPPRELSDVAKAVLDFEAALHAGTLRVADKNAEIQRRFGESVAGYEAKLTRLIRMHEAWVYAAEVVEWLRHQQEVRDRYGDQTGWW